MGAQRAAEDGTTEGTEEAGRVAGFMTTIAIRFGRLVGTRYAFAIHFAMKGRDEKLDGVGRG